MRIYFLTSDTVEEEEEKGNSLYMAAAAAAYHTHPPPRRGWVSRPLAARINRRCLFGLGRRRENLYIAAISTDTLSYRPFSLSLSDLNRWPRLGSTRQEETAYVSFFLYKKNERRYFSIDCLGVLKIRREKGQQ